MRDSVPARLVPKGKRNSGHSFGGIGFFNKEDSTRKGGTVQVRTSERESFEQNEDIEFAPAVRTQPARLVMILRRPSAVRRAAQRARGECG